MFLSKQNNNGVKEEASRLLSRRGIIGNTEPTNKTGSFEVPIGNPGVLDQYLMVIISWCRTRERNEKQQARRGKKRKRKTR